MSVWSIAIHAESVMCQLLHYIDETVKLVHNVCHTYIRSVENSQWCNCAVVCRHSRCAVVRWLIVVIYCPPRTSDSVRGTG